MIERVEEPWWGKSLHPVGNAMTSLRADLTTSGLGALAKSCRTSRLSRVLNQPISEHTGYREAFAHS
eukprot:9854633-Alexandrium_andersonii.AAC.1